MRPLSSLIINEDTVENMGLTESCCGGPRSVTSRRFRSDSDGDDDVDSSSSEVVQKKIEEKTTTISSRTIRKIQAKEEVKKRNLTPPPGISMIHENAFTPKTLISPPKIHTKKEEPPPKTSSTPPPKMPTKKNEPEIKKSPKEIDPKEILFRNIQEAQDGKRPELLAIKDAFNEIRSKDIVRSASMGYMFPVHASCRFTKKSSRQFCLQDFKAFGVYLSYSKQFRENLKTACDLLRSKLSSMHESELFEDEDKLIHLFESVTLYILAGAVIFRMIVDKTNKKKKGKTKKIAEKTKPESRTKLDKETWKKSCKNLVKDMKSFGDCFQAMQHLLKEKAFGGKLCARVVDEIVVYVGALDILFLSLSLHIIYIKLTCTQTYIHKQEGYHDFIHFRTLHDVKKYIQLPSKSKTSEEETDDIVGDLLTESESAVPRESFVHGQFNNVDYKHCWLSTSFQSLWHSNVFHVAFEKYVVRSIDNMDDKGMGTLKPGSVTRGLMETWKMYRKANGHSTVSPSAMASVWGNDHGDPVDCLNDISSRKAKLEPKQLSHLGLVLFGKGPHRGHGVVCTFL